MADASLLVISGPPGAGKSTVARLVTERIGAGPGAPSTVLVEGDEFFGFLAAGFVDPWLPESAEQNDVVIEAAAAATGRFVGAGWATVFDGVLGPWYLDRFLAASGVTEVDYVVLMPAVEHCRHRVTTRPDHPFTDLPATEKMHEEFSRESATLAPGHLLDSGDESPDRTVDRLLGARRAGRLRYRR